MPVTGGQKRLRPNWWRRPSSTRPLPMWHRRPTVAARLFVFLAVMIFSASSSRMAHGKADDMRARGAYLAMITGCVGCHSPRSEDGNVLTGQLLTGGNHPIPAGPLGRVYPPNITPDVQTGIGSWSIDDIVKALKEGSTPMGRIVSPAMPWRSQFNKLDLVDAQSIAIYLKSLPPVANHVPPPIPTANTPPPHPSP